MGLKRSSLDKLLEKGITIPMKEVVYKDGHCSLCGHTEYTLEGTGCEKCFSFKRKCTKCGNLNDGWEPLILC